MRSDFNEITNLIIINHLKENLQNHKFNIYINLDEITSGLIFINKFVSQLNELRVNADGLNLNDMKEIRNTLSNSNIKVCFVA